MAGVSQPATKAGCRASSYVAGLPLRPALPAFSTLCLSPLCPVHRRRRGRLRFRSQLLGCFDHAPAGRRQPLIRRREIVIELTRPNPTGRRVDEQLDGIQINRSRTNGFDYRGANNSIALINVQFEKGSELIASYKRWERQIAIK